MNTVGCRRADGNQCCLSTARLGVASPSRRPRPPLQNSCLSCDRPAKSVADFRCSSRLLRQAGTIFTTLMLIAGPKPQRSRDDDPSCLHWGLPRDVRSRRTGIGGGRMRCRLQRRAIGRLRPRWMAAGASRSERVPGHVEGNAALRSVSSMEPAIADVRAALRANLDMPYANGRFFEASIGPTRRR